MKRIALWLAKRCLTNHLLIDMETMEVLSGTLDIHILKLLTRRHLPNHHIHRSEGRGVRKARREMARRKAIEESYEAQDPR